MESFILGTGGMMPLPNRNLTSMLLRRNGDLFLFDCGEGTQISLRQLNLKWKKINVVLISHTHADHITGLPGILMLSAQVQRDEPLVIIGPPRVRDFIQSILNVLDIYINYPIEIHEIEEPHKAQQVYCGDGYAIRAFPLRHSRACVGYAFEVQSRPGIFHPEIAMELGIPRGPLWGLLQNGQTVEMDDGRLIHPHQVLGLARLGRKVSYVTDTAWRDDIPAHVSNSDLLLCEAMFAQDLAHSAREKKHLTAQQAGQLAFKAKGVARLGLFHYSPRYSNRDLKILKEECRQFFPTAFLCKDRMVIPLPYTDDDNDG